MMSQYNEIKSQCPDCILMYRLGDFFEMFNEDAVIASDILKITLTSRNKKNSNIPMCGIPFHAVDSYIAKLIRAGKKVAICDQVTKPDGKGIVKREIIRVITPGTTFDENIIGNKTNNYIASVLFNKGRVGFAFCDITTGEFKTAQFSDIKSFESEFIKLQSAECLYQTFSENDNININNVLLNKYKNIVYSRRNFTKDPAQYILEHFSVQSLSAFGLSDLNDATFASAVLIDYLKETQKNELKHIGKISILSDDKFMQIDDSSVRNLEIFYNRNGSLEGSLIWVLDQTKTPMGGRMLKQWIRKPLQDKAEIDKRLERVDFFTNNSSELRKVREILDRIFDIERLLSRLSLGTGNARDLVALNFSLKKVPDIKNMLLSQNIFEDLVPKLIDFSDLCSLIDSAIVDEAPLSVRDGNIIKDGFNSELDDLRSISGKGKSYIKELQEREIKRSGINSLKVRFNSVFGYYIEISKSNLSAVPSDYIRKQTLVNAERYITPELKEYEEKVLSAEEKIKELEYDLFYKVRIEVLKYLLQIQDCAKAIAVVDIVSNFAYIAEKYNYKKPLITERRNINIKNGRHPVIEQVGNANTFVPNDCIFSDEVRFLLITGPNMGGKSTYLRQNALIVLMAQTGCFVPAGSAEIGIVDRIFTRVGANDNLLKGESTFMVEMNEAANILNNSTEKSLIILDELGRGTSTYDGVSIAWAITEYIYENIKAKTIFATHYHELIELIKKLAEARNFSVQVSENSEGEIVFLYRVIEGAVDKSYGIEVAKLAGLPLEIISRAKEVLSELENKQFEYIEKNPKQPNLFVEAPERNHASIKDSDNSIIQSIKELDIDNITPLNALEKLSDIKKNLNSQQ